MGATTYIIISSPAGGYQCSSHREAPDNKQLGYHFSKVEIKLSIQFNQITKIIEDTKKLQVLQLQWIHNSVYLHIGTWQDLIARFLLQRFGTMYNDRSWLLI